MGARTGITRRRVITGAVGALGLSATATAVFAGAIEPEGLVVTRYAPKPPSWPADRKLTIAVIADIHAGGPNMRCRTSAAWSTPPNAPARRPDRAARRLYCDPTIS